MRNRYTHKSWKQNMVDLEPKKQHILLGVVFIARDLQGLGSMKKYQDRTVGKTLTEVVLADPDRREKARQQIAQLLQNINGGRIQSRKELDQLISLMKQGMGAKPHNKRIISLHTAVSDLKQWITDADSLRQGIKRDRTERRSAAHISALHDLTERLDGIHTSLSKLELCGIRAGDVFGVVIQELLDEAFHHDALTAQAEQMAGQEHL